MEAKNCEGKFFINFSPPVSNQAAKAIRDTFRRWNLPNRSDKVIEVCRGCSIRLSEAGSSITGDIIARRFIRRCAELNQDLAFGPSVNTKSCDAITDGRHAGSRAFRGALRSCLLTGRWGCGVAPWWELYELRGSCTVLREPRGETPRGYSPHRWIPVSDGRRSLPGKLTGAAGQVWAGTPSRQDAPD
jgi:hypothetical protein